MRGWRAFPCRGGRRSRGCGALERQTARMACVPNLTEDGVHEDSQLRSARMKGWRAFPFRGRRRSRGRGVSGRQKTRSNPREAHAGGEGAPCPPPRAPPSTPRLKSSQTQARRPSAAARRRQVQARFHKHARTQPVAFGRRFLAPAAATGMLRATDLRRTTFPQSRSFGVAGRRAVDE